MILTVRRGDLNSLVIYVSKGNGGRFLKGMLRDNSEWVGGQGEFVAILYFDNYPDYVRWCEVRKKKPVSVEEFMK